MTIEDIEEQTDEQIGRARKAIHQIGMDLTNLENTCWHIRYPDRRKAYRTLYSEQTKKYLPLESLYKKYSNDIELQSAILNEIVEKLMDLHGKLVEELADPSCPNCGEKMEVRTGVDSEGFHHCTGE